MKTNPTPSVLFRKFLVANYDVEELTMEEIEEIMDIWSAGFEACVLF